MIRATRIFAGLLLAAALTHAVGAWIGYSAMPETLVWAWSGSLAAALVAAINLLRAARPGDPAICWLAVAASLAWVGVAIGFGTAIGHVFDPRVFAHAVPAAALAGLATATLVGSRGSTTLIVGMKTP